MHRPPVGGVSGGVVQRNDSSDRILLHSPHHRNRPNRPAGGRQLVHLPRLRVIAIHRSHGNRLSNNRLHASAFEARTASGPEWIWRERLAAFSRSFPRLSARQALLARPPAVTASRLTSTAHRSPWMNGPARVFGLRRHLSRKSFAFFTQTGGPSCRRTRGRVSTANSNRNTAFLPATSKWESNTWNPFRWKRSRNARCALRSCG